MRIRQLLFATVALAGLSGCGVVPAGVALVSYAADGVSYLVTGKSTTDHALSAVADQDCALLRPLANEPVCEPEFDHDLASADMAHVVTGSDGSMPPAEAFPAGTDAAGWVEPDRR